MPVYLRIILVLVLLVLLDVYAYQSIRTLSADWSTLLKNSARIVFILSVLAFYGLVIYLLVNLGRRHEMRPLITFTFNTFLILYIPKFFPLILLLLEDVVRFLGYLFSLFSDGRAAQMPERRKFLSAIGLSLAALPFAGVIYGILKGQYDFRLHRKTIYYKDLPEEFDGFTILQLSDIHSGTFDDKAGLQKGIDLINKQNFDLCVFTGDMVNNKASELVPWMDQFKQIKTPEFGKYGVLGNHDYGDYVQWDSPKAKQENLQTLIRQNEEVGFKMLMNEHKTLTKAGKTIRLAGVENWGEKPFPQKGDLNKAMPQASSDFTILLSHDPTHWKQKVLDFREKVHLTLAGHTHGMQFGVELGNFKWSPVKYRYNNWIDLYEQDEQKLYVNRGFGCLGFEGRVGIWPEVALLTLRRQA